MIAILYLTIAIISHNYEFISRNCDSLVIAINFTSHNCYLVLNNSDFISYICDYLCIIMTFHICKSSISQFRETLFLVIATLHLKKLQLYF